MNYRETLDYLFSQLPMFHRVGAAAYKADLSNTIELCRILDNPQNSFPSIHVSGTNGKGSVSHLLASILKESGLKVGLFTSPHLKDFRERIKVNGKMIPKSEVSRFVSSHSKVFERISPSFFEMTAGLAFNHFRTCKVDIGVIEVGLGGRLDSTNVIHPLLSIITNISLDHTQFLGETLEKIAFEKAGIIKQGVPVVIGETQPETKNLFLKKANEMGCEISFADARYQVLPLKGPDLSMQGQKDSKDLNAFASLRFKNYQVYKNNELYLSQIQSPLLGNYQAKNLTTVIAACEILKIDEHAIHRGIKNVIRNTKFAGRWQILSGSPLTICDTGHNEGGLTEVLEQINATPHAHLHFVFGVVNDKQIDHILTMLPVKATYYFCKANIPRGLDANELRQKALENGLKGNSYESVTQALESARKSANKDDLIFIGGSTFVVAEVV